MSLSNDYQDEMGRLGSISDRELEQLAAGRTPAGDDMLEDLAAHLRTVRAACVATPDEFTQALHIAEITQTAQLLAENGEPVAAATRAIGPARQAYGLSKWRRRMEVARSSAIKLAAGVTAAMLSTVGFAYAGVDLPGQAAEEAFDAVFGVELPNQGNGDAEITGDGPDENADQTAFDVWAVISNWADERGCTFGQAVANAATGGENAPDCANAEGAGSQGDEASAKGRATADEASSDGRSTANEASGGRSEAGKETGDTASESGQSNNPSSGSDSGKETGDTASESGQSNNPTGSGSP